MPEISWTTVALGGPSNSMTLGTFVSRLVCTVKLMIVVAQNSSTADSEGVEGGKVVTVVRRDKGVGLIRVAASNALCVDKSTGWNVELR